MQENRSEMNTMNYSRRQILTALSLSALGHPVWFEAAPNAKKSFETFMTEWLVNQRVEIALKHFHSKAFASEKMLADDCISPIALEDHNNPLKVRLGVKLFLREVTRWKKGNRLKNILKDFERDQEEPVHGKVLGTMKGDHYFLVEAGDLNTWESEEERAYIQQLFPASTYLISMAVIRIKETKESPQEGELPLYTCWALEKDEWKIIHLVTQCM